VTPRELVGHGAGPGGDVQHPVARTGAHPRGQEAVPARLLPQAQDRRAARVGRPGQPREEGLRLGLGGDGRPRPSGVAPLAGATPSPGVRQ
jgi:hypothetical protein